MIIWLLPPIRQYGGKYFYFFLILAIADPLTYLLLKITQSNMNSINIISAFILFTILLNSKSFLRRWLILIPIFMLLIIINFVSYEFQHATLIFIHVLIIMLIFKITVVYIFDKNELNFFHFSLLLYEAIIVLRGIAILSELDTGIVFFYLCAIFQILLAIFFSIFREDKPKLSISLKKNYNL